MYHVSAQGIDERMINVHYYYYYKEIYSSSFVKKRRRKKKERNCVTYPFALYSLHLVMWIHVDFISCFVIYVWHPRFPFNGINKYLTWLDLT